VAINFWKVRIKPGKPLVFGSKGNCAVLGLPGNPVSAQLTCCLFALPLLRAMQGCRRVRPSPRIGTLAAPLRQKAGRLGFHRVRVEGNEVWPTSNQSSGSAISLAEADALAILPAEREHAATGEQIELLFLSEL